MPVRQAEEHDVAAIAALLGDAFDRPQEARLFRTLWGSEDMAAALVCEEDGEVVGVAILSHLDSPEGCVGLGPLAVSPAHRHQGFGKALIGESVEWAREAGRAAIFVVGEPMYYTRFGFSVEAARPFVSAYPADYLMALELKAGALARGGQVSYPAPFAGL